MGSKHAQLGNESARRERHSSPDYVAGMYVFAVCPQTFRLRVILMKFSNSWVEKRVISHLLLQAATHARSAASPLLCRMVATSIYRWAATSEKAMVDGNMYVSGLLQKSRAVTSQKHRRENQNAFSFPADTSWIKNTTVPAATAVASHSEPKTQALNSSEALGTLVTLQKHTHAVRASVTATKALKKVRARVCVTHYRPAAPTYASEPIDRAGPR